MNSKLESHIDSQSIVLIDLFETRERDPIVPLSDMEPLKGSMGNQGVEDLSGKLDLTKPMHTSSVDHNGTQYDHWILTETSKIGIAEEKYLTFRKFIDGLANSGSFRDKVDFKFLEETVFDWLVETYQIGKANDNLSSYIQEQVLASIVKKTFCFPIVNLDIHSRMKIGDIEITYLSEKDIDEMAIECKWSEEKDDCLEKMMRDKYQGRVYAACIQEGQIDRAENLAFERCSMTVDILKICSDTLEYPDMRLSFDIDSRANGRLEGEMFTHQPDSKRNFKITKSRLPHRTEISAEYFKRIKERGVGPLVRIIDPETEMTELNSLLRTAIQNFAYALSLTDLHRRIVELFSIFESLLLPHDSSPIQDSIVKYGCKIIFQKPEDRKELKKLLLKCYIIRSAMIHHGKRKAIDLRDLRQLQLALLFLMIRLVELSPTNSTKAAILEGIDDAINAAY